MSKRRATEQLQPAVTAKRHEAISGDRARLFKARLTSLNQQFASWVSGQAASCASQLWLDGVQQYQDHARALLEEFKDLVGEEAQISRPSDVAGPASDIIFGTPMAGTAAADGGSNSRDQSTAPLTGGSTGRKSVTWADANTAMTPAAAANGTPNPNTANAGHTPAPAGFGRFAADTPGGSSSSDMPTPTFKLPGSAAATPAGNAKNTNSTPAGPGGFSLSFDGGGNTTTPSTAGFGQGAAAAAADKTPPGSAAGGGITFGAGGGFGTPVSAAAAGGGAGKAAAAAGGTQSSSSPLFAFGTPVTTGAGFTPAAAADKAGGAGTAGFTFGTPATTTRSGAAANKSDTPTFGLAAAGGVGVGGSGSEKAKEQSAATPAVSFGLPQGSAGFKITSSLAYSFGAPEDSAAAAAAPKAGGDAAAAAAPEAPKASTPPAPDAAAKPSFFGFNAASSSAPAGTGGSSATAAAAAGTSGGGGGFSFGAAAASGSTPAGGTSSSSPGLIFGVGGASSNNNNTGSSGPAAFGSSTSAPVFGFGNTAAAPAAGSSTPAFAFGTLGGSAPAFGTSTTAGGFGSAAPAPATNGGLFKFPAPSAAAGGGGAADGSGGADAEEAAEPEEEKTVVQADSRWNVLYSEKVILYMNHRADDGTYSWQNRGKGMLSVRQLREGADSNKTYITFNSEGQGKQLVAHQLRPVDVCEAVPNQPLRVRINLVNTLYTVKKAEGEGSLPEPVTEHKMRMNIIRFASQQAKERFTALVDEHTGKAAAAQPN